jgi:von Willebrand factor type A domain
MATSHFGLAGAICVVTLCAASCGARTELNDGLVLDVPTNEAGTDAQVPCIPGVFQLQPANPSVMFVLDASGSMNEPFSVNGSTRWQVLGSSLAVVLPSVDQTMSIGATVFPDVSQQAVPPDQNCAGPSSVNLPPAIGNVNPLLNLIQSIGPVGGTPTADAISTAAQGLLSIRAASTARAIILATDGGPNCNTSLDSETCTCANPAETTCGKDPPPFDPQLCLDDTRTLSRITSFASQGLPTYVIGIHDPGDVQDEPVLNAMADAGGRPLSGTDHYYSATSQTDLENAFVAIRNQIGSCTYLTSSVPNGAGSISVTVNGVTIPFDPSGKQGWKWGDEANGEIIFVGQACTNLGASDGGTRKIDANVACSVPDASTGKDANVGD